MMKVNGTVTKITDLTKLASMSAKSSRLAHKMSAHKKLTRMKPIVTMVDLISKIAIDIELPIMIAVLVLRSNILLSRPCPRLRESANIQYRTKRRLLSAISNASTMTGQQETLLSHLRSIQMKTTDGEWNKFSVNSAVGPMTEGPTLIRIESVDVGNVNIACVSAWTCATASSTHP
jgi:hypothetical protein